MTRVDRGTVAISAVPFRDRLQTSELVSLLVLRVGDERFALDVAEVQEAVDVAGVTPVPKMRAGALGYVRWRGAARLAWSPASILRAAPRDVRTVVFLRADGDHVGVAVDDVDDLVTLPAGEIRPAAGVDDGAGLVLGVVHVGDALATVLDADVFVRSVLTMANA